MFKPRSVYSEVVNGFSIAKFNKDLIYFKHFLNTELGNFETQEELLYDDAHSQGLLTEKEKLETLIQDGLWSERQQNEIDQEKRFLEGRIATKKNLILDSQIIQINKEIEESQTKFDQLSFAKNQLLGTTVENFIRKRMNAEHIKFASYKDANLQNRLFSDDEFNEQVEDGDLEFLILSYNHCLDMLNKNIKKLALSSFFQNLFHLSKEDIFGFYGKPVINLTLYQIDTYIYARFFDPMINGENKPSEEMLENPELLIEQYQKNANLKGAMSEIKGDLGGGSVVGAKRDEFKNAGVEGKFINFRARLKEGQGELDATQLANIFNGN